MSCGVIKVNSLMSVLPNQNLLDMPVEPSPTPVVGDVWSCDLMEAQLLSSRMNRSQSLMDSSNAGGGGAGSSSPSASFGNGSSPFVLSGIESGKEIHSGGVKMERNLNSIGSLGDFPPCPQPRGTYLSPENIFQLQTFMKDFCSQYLVPHMERNIQIWNEQVQQG